MKNRNKRNRHELKQARQTRNAIIVMMLVGVAICVAYYILTRSPTPEPEIESYVRSMVTQKDISPGLEPAAIYFRHTGMTTDVFCCVGTIFRDANQGVQIATAEHVFRTDIHSSQVLSVKALRGNMDPPVTYVTRIIASGRQLGGPNHDERDIVVASLGTKPVVLAPYSSFLESEIGQNFWGEVVIGKTKIPRLRSLLSGEYVDAGIFPTRRRDKRSRVRDHQPPCAAR